MSWSDNEKNIGRAAKGVSNKVFGVIKGFRPLKSKILGGAGQLRGCHLHDQTKKIL